jgi:hypothetical protein
MVTVLAPAAVQPARGGQAARNSSGAAGQITQDDVNAEFFSVIKAIKQDKSKNDLQAVHQDIAENLVPYVTLAAAQPESLRAEFRSQVQEWRTDVQTANPPASKGTTSVVSKGSVPYLLGLAAENGALTQMTSGTLVTFRTNPTGLIKALQKYGYAGSGPDSYTDPAMKFVKNFSAAVTFNTGAATNTSTIGQGSQVGTLTGSAQQISSFDVRYDIVNHRDPRDPRYSEKWSKLRSGALASVSKSLHEYGEQLKGIPQEKKFEAAKTDANDKRRGYDDAKSEIDKWEASDPAKRPHEPPVSPEDLSKSQRAWQQAERDAQAAYDAYQSQNDKFSGWRNRAIQTIDNAGVDAVNSAVLAVAQDFVKTFADDPAIKAAADTAADAISDFLKQEGGIRNQVSKSPIVTLEYTDMLQGSITTAMASGSTQAMTSSAMLPSLSNFKLIVAGGTVGGTTLTGNASLTIFNSIPAGTKTGRVRDFQLSGEADVPLKEIGTLGVPTLTFAGVFLSLQQQPLGMPIEVNGVTVNMKGNLGLAQAKISFPVKKGSGVRVPLSITYASRTEFNREHDVSGQIGVTFNLDSVFAAMKP